MNASPSPAPAVDMPRAALTVLSHRCAALGPDGVRALREAGYRAGLEVLPTIDEVPERLPVRTFWERLDTRLTESGFGSVEFEPHSPSVGAIAWRRSPEAGGTRAERAVVRCHFAAGLLGGILSRVAGKTVDVLEVRCGSGNGGSCRFLFGSVASLREAQGEGGSERSELVANAVSGRRGYGSDRGHGRARRSGSRGAGSDGGDGPDEHGPGGGDGPGERRPDRGDGPDSGGNPSGERP